MTVSVDADLVAAGAAAVADGKAESVSAWVNDALAERAARDRRLAALAEAVAAYETEHGEIGAEELADQARADRDAAAGVRAKAIRRRGVA
ncbi:MAG TPA: hypothetical protein VGR20_00650 [Acidimicrobiia bacterium]|nr:hypothetical protein [Acidimicrobiia bacterium]